MFTFRLQRLLELREKAEQAKALELTTAQQRAESARRERDALAALHASSRAEVSAAQRTEPRVGHLTQLGVVLQSLDQRLESASETLRAADHVVIGAQKLLDDAARERRVLDRLKIRHSDQWRTEEAHKDRLGMDEIALSRFSRSADARTADNAATKTGAGDDRPDTLRSDNTPT